MNSEWIFIGDVIKDLTLPNLNQIELNIQAKNEKDYIAYSKYSATNLFVYLSHECAFHEGKTKSFLIAPLSNTPRDVDIDALEKTNDVTTAPQNLNSYFYGILPGICEQPLVIDFNRIMHISSKNRQMILKNKVFELPLDDRKKLKNKLGFYFIHGNSEFAID